MIYVLSLLSTRENKKEGIFPMVDSCGDENNLSSEILCLSDDLDKVFKAFNDYYEKSVGGATETPTLKIRRKGNGITAKIVIIDTDECGNTWKTIVKLDTMRVDNDFDLDRLVRDNYI